MEIERENHDQIINVASSAVMFLLAIGFAIAAEVLDVRWLHFFAGWFCRSAWTRTDARTVDQEVDHE